MEAFIPLEAPQSLGDVEITRAQLQQVMWRCTGIYRDEEGLREGLQFIRNARVTGETVTARETRNLLAIGGVMMTAALARCESRGGHFRSDYPQTRESFQHHFSIGDVTEETTLEQVPQEAVAL